jgi:YbbR domain-containing protein
MTRLLNLIDYNRPMKVLAIALATLLYGFVVLSENQQTPDVRVDIKAVNQPTDTVLVGTLGEVTQVRIFISDPSGVTLSSANFTATVDLSRVQPGAQAQSVPVVVVSADPRIQVIAATPAFISVRLEQVVSKDVPVNVDVGPVPSGLDVQPPEFDAKTASVRGAQSAVARVTAVRATVPIGPSGLHIDGDFPLVAVDSLLEPVLGVNVEPATIRVTVVVFKDRTTATVPIVPVVTGDPGGGFEVVGVSVDTPVVSLEGNAEDLATIATVSTLRVSFAGQTSDVDQSVGFYLPQGIWAVEPANVRVHVLIRPITKSRTFTTGIVITNPEADRTYELSVPEAQVTIGGAPADLDPLSGANLSLIADVRGLAPGTHVVTLTADPGPRLNVIAISPATITVTVTAVAPASPAPSASAGG